ncbi:U-scoloptoxin(19)-Tl1a isoform X1 [Drosophila ficusphila]|uniref:U-scoloptoxin(19)-Tl1a isoform X1 n=1 Tax=Drosophila ficusphila TaxID=30025 RepID=UPI0007E6580F|nr:U-scoloptoxin(19)-Tl1a isoform X1 [Drosophila ficusphila]
MSLRKSLLGCLLLVGTILMLSQVQANIDTNEVDPDFYMLQGVRVYPNDRQCVLVGGLCVQTKDCLEPTSNKGLCPTSAGQGVECCYELPVRPAPCAEHLGQCMDRCHQRLLRPGTDCQNGQVCCVLI